MARGAHSMGAAALLLVLVGCNTQRWPGPMESLVEPLPVGDVAQFEPGPQEVAIWRHSDPVYVRKVAGAGAYGLSAHENKARLLSGGRLFVGSGGRAEVLWQENGTNVILFDGGICVIGEPSRGEAELIFRRIQSVRAFLAPDVRLRLPGGAIVTGPPAENSLGTSGPFFLERVSENVVRVRNQSPDNARVMFREEVFEIGPGHLVDVAMLENDSSPRPLDPSEEDLSGGGIDARVLGEVAHEPGDGSLGLRALVPSRVRARGVTVRLEDGETLVLTGLGSGGPAPPPAPAPAPAPEAVADEAPEPETPPAEAADTGEPPTPDPTTPAPMIQAPSVEAEAGTDPAAAGGAPPPDTRR
jgi:hypothetical protein